MTRRLSIKRNIIYNELLQKNLYKFLYKCTRITGFMGNRIASKYIILIVSYYYANRFSDYILIPRSKQYLNKLIFLVFSSCIPYFRRSGSIV